MTRLLAWRGAAGRFAAAHRTPIVSAAILVFVGLLAVFAAQLGLRFADLRGDAVVLAFLTVPFGMALNALELRLCVRATGRDLPFGAAFLHSSVATLANILPLPAGLAWRAKVIADGGAGAVTIGRILLLAGLLWIALSTLCVALALLVGAHGATGLALLALAAVASLAVAGIIAWTATPLVAAGFVAVRVAAIAVVVLRIDLCLLAIGVEVPMVEAAIFALAGVVGNAVGFVPAGIGVAEGVAALLATLVTVAPAAAFVALALSRLLCWAACLAPLALFAARRAPAPS